MPKTVSFLLEEEQWNKLAEAAQQKGTTPNALAKEIVLAWINGGGTPPQGGNGDYAKKQDLLELARIVQTVMDRLDALEQKVAGIEQRLAQQPVPPRYPSGPEQPPPQYQQGPPQYRQEGPIPPDVDKAPPGDPWAEFQGPGPKEPQQDQGWQQRGGYGGYQRGGYQRGGYGGGYGGYQRSGGYYRGKRGYRGYGGYQGY